MTPPLFKKFIPPSAKSFFALAVLAVIMACIEIPSGNLMLSMFSAETMGPTRFQPYFFTLDSLYYGNNDVEKVYDERTANTQEWARYFNNKVNRPAITKVVYDYTINMYNTVGDMKADTNSCVQWMVNHNDEEAFKYLQFTRLCENVCVDKSGRAYWDYDEKQLLQDSLKREERIKEVLVVLPTVKSGFIKLRYAYQLVRLACFNQRYKDCIAYYDKYVQPVKQNSIIKYWALSLKARALYKTAKPEYSKYCYAMVFDRCNTRRDKAKEGFYWAMAYYSKPEGGKYPHGPTAITYCKTEREKIPVYALTSMLAVYDNADLLDSIYRIDKKSEMLEWLLTRGVNQLEYDVLPDKTNYNPWGYNVYDSSSGKGNWFADTSMLGKDGTFGDMQGYDYGYGYDYLLYQNASPADLARIAPHQHEPDKPGPTITLGNQTKFLEFVSACATNNDTRKPALWNLSAAYLHCLNGDYATAKTFLAKVDEPNNRVIQSQKTVIDILIKIRELNPQAIDEAKENEIAHDFETLNHCSPVMRLHDVRSALLLQLSAKYDAKGDRLKASLCEAASSWSMDLTEWPREKPLDEMIAFSERKNKTAFEKLIDHSAGTNLRILYEMKGTVLLTQYRYKDAIAAFLKTDTVVFSSANPFMIHIRDCHDCDYTIADSVRDHTGKRITYTQLELAQRLLELETKTITAKGEELAQTYFLLANAAYNMSFYGNSWGVTEYPHSSYWWGGNDEYYSKPHPYYHPFFDCTRAKDYYLKAMANTTDKEFAARCCFMAAKCGQNAAYTKNSHSKSERNRYFKQLKNDYTATGFYKDALNECEYFKMYVDKF